MATRRTPPDLPPKADRTATPKAPARRARRTKAKADSAASAVTVSEEIRRGMIAEAAYFHAERRGFAPGNESQDWLKAEAEIDALLKSTMHGTLPQ